MRVLIPAAGLGSRFQTVGYVEPKPLVNVLGAPMISRVADMARGIDPSPLVICLAPFANRIRSLGLTPLPIQHMQSEGAAMSVLCANGWIHDDEPVMIINSDNLFEQSWFDRFAAQAQLRASQGAGAILTLKVDCKIGKPSIWSHVAIDANSKVTKVAEKIAVGPLATGGAYVFPSWKALRTAACKMVAANLRYNNEFYLAPVYSFADFDTYSFEIPENSFHCVGTPEHLQAYTAKMSQQDIVLPKKVKKSEKE